MRESPDAFSGVRFAEVRAQDRIAARVRKISHDAAFEEVRVWSISPFGLEFIAPSTEDQFAVGEFVQVDLVIFGQRSSFNGIVLRLEPNHQAGTLASARFVYEEEKGGRAGERKGPRWLCSDNFYPVGVAPSPSYFDDWMYFQVRDISKGGLQLSTSLRNKYLLPGTTIQLSLMFPASGNFSVGLRIRRVGVLTLGSRDLLLVGGEMEGVSPQARNVIGQYLIQFAPQVTIDTLKDAGYLPESLFRGSTIRYVKTTEDYQRVLALRLKANGDSGQLGEAQESKDMIDSADSRSRILLVTRGDESIATVRIRYPEPGNPLEVEQYIAWPSHLPRQEEMFEVSRLAIDSRYRGKDVLPSVFHFISLSAIGADRPWVTVSAMAKYVPFYVKVGFQSTGLKYKDERWSDELHVLVGHTLKAIKGEGTSPLYWFVMWSKVLENLERDGVVKLNGLERVRIRLYRLLGFGTQLIKRIRE